MNVLSLFDGMSCGQIALERTGIKVNKYFASEIDKYAMKVTQANYPNTIQLGDVQFVTKQTFGLHKIDLLIGGSPCQGFSFAGKQLNFEDPRSRLFFEYVRLLKELTPKYFLLENVKMKKESQDIISKYLGCDPIEINSALVSAQNRKRLYWTNIPGIEQPEDRGILLKDILEDGSNQIAASRGRYLVDGKRQDAKMKTAGLTTQRLELRKDNKSNTLTTVQKDNYVIKDYNHSEKALDYMNRKLKGGGSRWDFGYIQTTDKDKSRCLTANIHKGVPYNVLVDSKPKNGEALKNPKVFRKLTPIECERLQTVPDNYTNHVSNSQRYKMLGNGWNVDTIIHIFKGMKFELSAL